MVKKYAVSGTKTSLHKDNKEYSILKHYKKGVFKKNLVCYLATRLAVNTGMFLLNEHLSEFWIYFF